MDTEDDREPEGMVCVRCGELNDFAASRCIQCGAPLDDFASSAPWEMGTAVGSSYPNPVDPRTKPIIFWGVWLYFGPSAVGSIWLIGSTLHLFITGEAGSKLAASEIAMMLLAALYGSLSFWALWSVSIRFFKRE